MNVSVDRLVSLEILTDILDGGGFNNVVLKRALSKHKELSVVQRGFVTEVVNGTLRNLIWIDYVIGCFCNTAKSKLYVKNILRMSVYQIAKMRAPDSAVTNEAVNLAKYKGFSGLSGLVNAVLRNYIRNADAIVFPDMSTEPVRYLSVMYSCPVWLVEYLLSCYSFDFVESFCAAANVVPAVSVCTNTLKCTPQSLISSFSQEGILVSPGLFFTEALRLKKVPDLQSLSAFNKGLFHIQDESSMIAVSALDPQPNDFIIDVCAAPGGKSIRMAQLMNNKGRIVARDVNEYRLSLVKDTAVRMGITIIDTVLLDATCSNTSLDILADRVLVDAPCSGLGLLSKKPDVRYLKSKEQILSLATLQRDILKAAVSFLRDGGILVFCTCTLTDLENIDNVNWALCNLPLVLDDLSPFVPSGCSSPFLGIVELFPHVHGTDGFFIARFRKKAC